MFRIDRALQPYRESGSLNDRINLFGFIDDRVFLTKSGDVGVILAVKGVDYEGLAAAEIDNYTKRLESAFKIFDEKCRVYQYLFKRSGETVSPQTYENPIVNAAIRNRAAFLRSKAQDLYALDIYYAVLMEGPEARKAIFATLAQAVAVPAALGGTPRPRFDAPPGRAHGRRDHPRPAAPRSAGREFYSPGQGLHARRNC